MTLKLFVLIENRHMRSYIVLGLMVPELHDMCIVCLLKAVTPAWVANTASFILKIDYTPHFDSFEILQVRFKCHLSIGPVRPVPRALTKQYFARGGPISVSFIYIPRCC